MGYLPSQNQLVTPPKFNIAPENGGLEECFSFWDANFAGAMLNFRWVVGFLNHQQHYK